MEMNDGTSTFVQPVFLTEKKHFENLKLKDQIYRVFNDHIDSYYYAGFNPASANLVMLVSTGNIEKIECIYLPNLQKANAVKFLADYNQAKQVMLENAVKNVEIIKEIYFNIHKK